MTISKLRLAAWLCMLSISAATAQRLQGAWKLASQNGKPIEEECIKIYSDGYFMFAMHKRDGAFIKAGGGTYEMKGGNYSEVHDFYTSDSMQVRQPISGSAELKKDELTLSIKNGGSVVKEVWKKIDDTSTSLAGAWRFGARVDDNGLAGSRRGADSPRQTMKILSGQYFQWAAFNHETKQFSGTGGGTYALNDGQYTETIRFFSRDNTRVGKSLTFQCKLEGSDWYHKGKGTTGNPVSEVWEKVN